MNRRTVVTKTMAARAMARKESSIGNYPVFVVVQMSICLKYIFIKEKSLKLLLSTIVKVWIA